MKLHAILTREPKSTELILRAEFVHANYPVVCRGQCRSLGFELDGRARRCPGLAIAGHVFECLLFAKKIARACTIMRAPKGISYTTWLGSKHYTNQCSGCRLSVKVRELLISTKCGQTGTRSTLATLFLLIRIKIVSSGQSSM